MTNVKIIAEAGVNHNGDLQLALELVDAAAEAGVDIVKFQTFKAANIVTKKASKANYQQQTTDAAESQYDMLKRLELSYDAHFELVERCNNRGISFLSTAFDAESLGFLVKELRLPMLKIPSGEITNAPLLLEHAYAGVELVVSTGMASLGEIEEALGVLAYGLMQGDCPKRESFREAYSSLEGQELLKEKVTLLHCTSEYPAPFDQINLNAMKTLEQAFGLPVGYSDHSAGIAVPIAAVALGAPVIEKHFTLDKSLEGPDHKASLDPRELATMVGSMREIERALGSSLKSPTIAEQKTLQVVRKSLVAQTSIKAGEVFSVDNIAVKRPAQGVSPILYWDLLGKVSDRDYEEDQLIL